LLVVSMESAAHPLREGDPMQEALIAGRYRMLGMIGEGGMGEVLRAEDTLASAEVCLKRTLGGDTRSALVARMDREFRAGHMIAHPHLLSILDLVHDQGQPVLVMELIRGPTLEQLTQLSAGHGLRASGVVALGRQLASGLAFFHRWVGEKHRDIKPANILIEPLEPRPLERWSMADLEPPPGAPPNYRAMIADFGLVTGAAQISRSDALPPGTARFMAPELLDGGGPATFASDLYSLGRTLECAALGVPVPPDAQPHTGLRHLLGDRVGRILNTLLAPTPEARFHSAADVEAEFAQIENESAPTASGSQGNRSYWRRALLAELLRLCDTPAESGGRILLLRGPLLSGRATLLQRVSEIIGAPVTSIRPGDLHPLTPLARLARSILARSATISSTLRTRLLGADETSLRILAEIDNGSPPGPEAASEMLAPALGRTLSRYFERGSPVLVVHHLDRASAPAIRALNLLLRECSRITLLASSGIAPLPDACREFLAQARRRWWEIREIDAGEIPPTEAARWLRLECEGLAPEEAEQIAPRALRWFGRGARALALGLRSLQKLHCSQQPLQIADAPQSRGLTSHLLNGGVWPRPPRLLQTYRQVMEGISDKGRVLLAALTLTQDGLTIDELAIGLDDSAIDAALEELRIAGLARDAGIEGPLPSLLLNADLLADEIDASCISPVTFHRRIAAALDSATSLVALRKCAYHLEQSEQIHEAASKLCELAALLDTRRPAEALRHRLRALELNRDAARRPSYLLAAAEVAVHDDLPRAEELFRVALRENAKSTQALLGIECRARAGLIIIGLYTARIRQMQAQLEALDALGELPTQLESWRILAHAIMTLPSDPGASIAHLDRSPPRECGVIGNDVICWVECRCLALIRLGAYREAGQIAQSWGDRAVNAGHQVATMIFQRLAGRTEYSLGNITKAEQSMSAALQLARQMESGFRTSQIARQLAGIVEHTRPTETAWQLLRLASSAAPKCSAVQQAITQDSLAGLCMEAGRLSQAEIHFQQAAALFHELHYNDYWLVTQAHLTELRVLRRDLPGAREAHSEVRAFLEALPEPAPTRLRQFFTWAQIYEGILRLEEGEPQRALELLTHTRPSPLCGAGYLSQRIVRADGLCQALSKSGERGAAERIARRYARWSLQPEHVDLAPWAHLLLARVLIDSGRYADALAEVRRAHGIAVARGQRSEEARIFATAAHAYEKWGRLDQYEMCLAIEKMVRQWPETGNPA
jgi:serine/threonine protein kinase/tetratricopeptide (TPR) repeat protein